MAFAAMFIATIVIVIILIGFGLLLIGIILDIIWGVRQHKEKKVYVVHKVFAVILTVVGALAGIGPIAGIGFLTLKEKAEVRAEISDLAEEDLVRVSDLDNVYQEFDFKGVHYVCVEEMSAQTAHDNFVMDKVGAFVMDNGGHRRIYSIRNTLGITILTIERSSNVFVERSNIDRMFEYYEKEAPLYSEAMPMDADHSYTTENIDSARARKIRDLISEKGMRFSRDDYDHTDTQGYIIFYSTDDMSCFDFHYYKTSEGLFVSYADYGLIVDKDDADYIMSLLGK